MSRLAKKRFESGRCRYCRCTEDHGCMLSYAERKASRDMLPQSLRESFSSFLTLLTNQELGCSWIDRRKTVCSNPRCVKKHKIRQRAKRMRRRTRLANGRQLGQRRSA